MRTDVYAINECYLSKQSRRPCTNIERDLSRLVDVAGVGLHLLVEGVELLLGEPASLARDHADGAESGDEDGEEHGRGDPLIHHITARQAICMMVNFLRVGRATDLVRGEEEGILAGSVMRVMPTRSRNSLPRIAASPR